mgnify:CR=1 FL=1
MKASNDNSKIGYKEVQSKDTKTSKMILYKPNQHLLQVANSDEEGNCPTCYHPLR